MDASRGVRENSFGFEHLLNTTSVGQLKALFDALPSSVIIVNADGQFLYINQRGLELYGIDHFDFDMTVHSSKVKALKLNGEPFPLEEMPVSRSLKSGQVVRNFEMIIESMNGIRRPVNVSSSPLYDNQGNVNGAVVIFEDNTERKQWEEDKKYRALFDNTEYGTVLYEPLLNEEGVLSDLRYLELNPAVWKANGLKVADFRGKRVKEIVPEIGAEWMNEFDIVYRTGKSSRYEGYSEYTDRWYEQVIFPLPNGLLGEQFIDITKRKQVENALQESEKCANELVKQLEQADKSKNEFISVLSHELRNPLAAIVVALSLLEISRDIQQRERTSGIINRQIKQLCKLVDDLLDLTRITQNKIKIKKELINLNEIVLNAIKDLEPEFEKKGIQLIVEITKRPVFLDADPVRISQAIGNILFNALKFSGKDGVVSLTLHNKENEAEICIKDNGIGISPEILAQLFKPFTQADNSIHRNGNGGLGLGLSIVKGIVDMHDGNVMASSDGLGKGAEFTIHLPIKNENIEIEDNAMMDKTKHRYRILIIEDNKDFADILCSMLDMLGHEAFAADNGMDGIEKAREIRPDVIICDIGLPIMDGFEVAKRVRGEESIQNVYMVALTGYTHQSNIEKALESGFDKHLQKPITIDTIKKMLNGIEP